MATNASDERRAGGGPHSGDAAPSLRPDRLGYADSGRDECVLVIGFDFGTSTSKIVVHAPYIPDTPRFLARREHRTSDDGDWLWPSSFTEDANGVCKLDGDDAGRPYRGIKMDLMEAASARADTKGGAAARKAVAAYFGLMLRSVRTRILETHADVLQTFETLDWSLNVGIPSGWTETQSREGPSREALKQAFGSAVHAGWRLSLRDTPIRLRDAEEALGSGKKADIDIGLFPEVIAGAFGYARSGERRDGLHLMFDVGAGTVDACLFRLGTKDDEEYWPLLEARVKRLGTAKLHERRVAAVRCVDEQEAERLLRSYDPFDGKAASPTTPCPHNPARSAVVEADKGMTKDVRRLAGYFVEKAITGRDPHAAEFKAGGGLPILLTGGGSRAALYDRALRHLGVTLRRNLTKAQLGARVLRARVPRELDRTTRRMGYRLTVAVGLSEPKMNLPTHKWPSAIPDIPMAAPRRRRPEFVDKDQV